MGMAFGNPASWDLTVGKGELHILQEKQYLIQRMIRTGFTHSEEKLPSISSSRICVFYFGPDNPVRTRMKGVMAFAPGSNLFDLYVAPVEGWTEWVQYNVAHEYHHSAWMGANPNHDPYGFTLLEYLVFEGRADNFASEVTKMRGPWDHALSATQECELFTQITPLLKTTGPVLPEVMFGRGNKYPTWTGYTLGFAIVNSYVARHPKESVEHWTMLNASALLAGSGYSLCSSPAGQ